VKFQYFVDTPERRVTVRSREVGWSTMKGVDLALVELSATRTTAPTFTQEHPDRR
jgi:hypothetical protein